MELSNRVKVWLTVPESHVDSVRLAIGDAGLGVIGNYSHCSFVTKGMGYSKPNEQADPHIGESGSLEEISEFVIEFVCHTEELSTLKKVLQKHHPYEEVAIDIFPLLDW